MKLVVIVKRGDVVDSQLHAKTSGVDDEECPDSVVLNRQQKGCDASALIGNRAFLAKFFIVPIRRILREEVVNDTHDEQGDTGNHHGEPPPEELIHTETEHSSKDERHNHLGDTPTEIPPARRSRIRCANAIRRKHHRSVILRNDERRTNRTDCQPEQQKCLITSRKPDTHHRNRTEDEEPRIRLPRTDFVTQRPD